MRRLNENYINRAVRTSINNVLNEISSKKLGDAYGAAKDRESIFKDAPGYPDTPMRRHYNDDGSLDTAQYERDSENGLRWSKQPQKFKNAALRQLSREVCGEDDFFSFLVKYVQRNGTDATLQRMIQDYKDGENYIINNKTKWSGRDNY